MQQLDAFLATLAPGPSQSVADLTVFPLLRQPAPDPWYAPSPKPSPAARPASPRSPTQAASPSFAWSTKAHATS